jgi:putative ABC transport system permease protein
MSSNIRPILSALLRNRTGAVLVAMQIALALAILVNATYIVKQRVDTINRPTGLDEANILAIRAFGFTARYDHPSAVRADLAWLRSLDGVESATMSNAIPLTMSGSSSSLFRTADRNTSGELYSMEYQIDEHGIETLGTHIIAGRNFRAAEILPPLSSNHGDQPIPSIIVTESLAKLLFPNDSAVGKTVYDSQGRPTTIIGVTADIFSGPWTHPAEAAYTAFLPEVPLTWGFCYLVRVKPGRINDVMRIVMQQMPGLNVDRVVKSVHPLSLFKKWVYLNERVTVIFLVITTTLLLAIAALGIFGLATFNVSTRTKQIGIRRAIGARRRDVIQYFMVENGLVTSAGILTGCALALTVGYELSLHYQLPRLDLFYLVGGILILWVIGQLAAWQPARRAATVSPSVATRTA